MLTGRLDGKSVRVIAILVVCAIKIPVLLWPSVRTHDPNSIMHALAAKVHERALMMPIIRVACP